MRENRAAMNRISKADFAEIFSSFTIPEHEPVTNVTEDTEETEDSQETERKLSETEREQSECANAHFFQLPLRAFVEQALVANADAMIANLEGRWLSPTWTFTRLCKGHPVLEKLDAGTAWRKVRPLLNAVNGWDQFDVEADEVELGFLYEWDSVRVPAGKTALTEAVSRAGRIALRPPVDRGNLYTRFLSIVGHLQALRRGIEIMIPVANFADVLGCAKMTVSRLIQFAIEDGLLQVVEAHSYAKHKARRYRFALERYPDL